jgi:Xaa-Pro aminopeptidase
MIMEFLSTHILIKIGIEHTNISYKNYLTFSQKMKNGKFSDISELIELQRVIKDEDEIQKLQKAAEIGDIGFKAAHTAIDEFLTEDEVQAETEYAMKKAGGTKPSFETIVVSGENSAFPHGHATYKQIKKGDLVTVDLGSIYDGYCSDMTRTVIAGGESSAEIKKILKTVNNAHQIGQDAVICGKHWGHPDKMVRKFYRENDVLDYYVHSLGHGVGVEVHESPWINHNHFSSTEIIQKNMVFTIEPGLYIPGVGGARTENTVVVREDGFDILNKSEIFEY